jgi:hypothetical protein
MERALALRGLWPARLGSASAAVPRALPSREASVPQALPLRVALRLRVRALLPGQPRASVQGDAVSARVQAALPVAA